MLITTAVIISRFGRVRLQVYVQRL